MCKSLSGYKLEARDVRGGEWGGDSICRDPDTRAERFSVSPNFLSNKFSLLWEEI